jgi:hypothetical protein
MAAEGEGTEEGLDPWVMIVGTVLLLLVLGLGVAILTGSMGSVTDALKGIVEAINNFGKRGFGG